MVFMRGVVLLPEQNGYSFDAKGKGANVMQAIATKQINIESIMGAIAAKMDSAAFTTWVAPLQVNVCQNCLNLVAQNQFTADYVKNQYGNILKNTVADFSLDINICVGGVVNSEIGANDNVVCEYTPNKAQTKQKNNGFDAFINCDENMDYEPLCRTYENG